MGPLGAAEAGLKGLGSLNALPQPPSSGPRAVRCLPRRHRLKSHSSFPLLAQLHIRYAKVPWFPVPTDAPRHPTLERRVCHSCSAGTASVIAPQAEPFSSTASGRLAALPAALGSPPWPGLPAQLFPWWPPMGSSAAEPGCLLQAFQGDLPVPGVPEDLDQLDSKLILSSPPGAPAVPWSAGIFLSALVPALLVANPRQKCLSLSLLLVPKPAEPFAIWSGVQQTQAGAL